MGDFVIKIWIYHNIFRALSAVIILLVPQKCVCGKELCPFCKWQPGKYVLWLLIDIFLSAIPVSLRRRSPQTRQFDASLGSCHSQEAVAGNQVLSNCFISHVRISVIFPLAILWWEIRDAEANATLHHLGGLQPNYTLLNRNLTKAYNTGRKWITFPILSGCLLVIQLVCSFTQSMQGKYYFTFVL